VIYAALFVLPLIMGRETDTTDVRPSVSMLHLVGLGLLIHMALDGLDCLI
jgi:hypothetical protein